MICVLVDMPASSNFQEAIREAQSSLVGPGVVNKALPYVGGGMVLVRGFEGQFLASEAYLCPVLGGIDRKFGCSSLRRTSQ